MCWRSKTANIQIAKSDIPILKVINNDLTAPYYDFQYEFGKVFTYDKPLRVDVTFLQECLIDEGFHSYALRKVLIKKDEQSIWFTKNNIIVGSFRCENRILVEGVVPKGATYYINDNGEIVSNQIKLIKVCAGFQVQNRFHRLLNRIFQFLK